MNVWYFVGKTLVLAQLCGLFMTASVAAVEIPNPYLAAVPVLDQSQKERARAIRRGLSDVLVRISGSEQAVDNERVRVSLRKPDHYLSEFGYSALDQKAAVVGKNYTQLAKVRYDAYLVNQLLRDADLPVWGRNRPDLLVWLAIEDRDARQQVISATETVSVKGALTAAAARRGVPLIFPLMDLEDSNRLSYTELWDLFRDKLEIASYRYAPGAVLAGKLYRRADDSWSGHWLFLFNGGAYGFATQTVEQGQGAVQALGVATDYLADHYVVKSGGGGSITVSFEVLGVASVRDYAQTMRYLEKVSMVRQVSLVSIEKDRLVVDITADGDLEKLQETIALDRKLTRVQRLSGTSDREKLTYQWLAL